MVEHNLHVVSKLADRITVLQRGAILTEGNYETVSADPRVKEAYLGVAADELEEQEQQAASEEKASEEKTA